MADLENQTVGPEATLGSYRIVKTLGRGGMGIVYLAEDKMLKRQVAIKVLSELLSNNDIYVKRFIREAQSMARIKHENVISIYHIGQEKNLIYFAMELVDGKPLNQLIKEEYSWDTVTVVHLTMQIVSALNAAYQKDVIHRDLKPANIMLDSDMQVRLLDFGLSKVLSETAGLTESGYLMGTPQYVSPEQAQGKAVDHRTDMYSLGALLHHLISGTPPFQGDTPLSVAMKHVSEPIPPLIEKNLVVPPRFKAMINRLMAKKPELRYQTYEDIHAELIEIQKELSASASGFESRTSPTVSNSATNAKNQSSPSLAQHTSSPNSQYNSSASGASHVRVLQPATPIKKSHSFFKMMIFLLILGCLGMYFFFRSTDRLPDNPNEMRLDEKIQSPDSQNSNHKEVRSTSRTQQATDFQPEDFSFMNDLGASTDDKKDNKKGGSQSLGEEAQKSNSDRQRGLEALRLAKEQYQKASDISSKERLLRNFHDIQRDYANQSDIVQETQQYINILDQELRSFGKQNDSRRNQPNGDRDRRPPPP